MQKAEYTGVKIKLGDEEKIITPQQAEELRDALVQLLGTKPFTNPYAAYMQQAQDALNKPHINLPQPMLRDWPGKRPEVWCSVEQTRMGDGDISNPHPH